MVQGARSTTDVGDCEGGDCGSPWKGRIVPGKQLRFSILFMCVLPPEGGCGPSATVGRWPHSQFPFIILPPIWPYHTYPTPQEPHLVEWVNHLRAALYTSIAWCGVVLVALTFLPGKTESTVHTLSLVLYIGLGPMMVLGALASFLRLRRWQVTVWLRFRAAAPGTRPKDIWRFKDPRDVELAMRCLRK